MVDKTKRTRQRVKKKSLDYIKQSGLFLYTVVILNLRHAIER